MKPVLIPLPEKPTFRRMLKPLKKTGEKPSVLCAPLPPEPAKPDLNLCDTAIAITRRVDGKRCGYLKAWRKDELMHIFVDADACPVKQEVYRVAGRYRLNVTLVSNAWMRVPDDEGIALEVVSNGFDAADDWIVAHIQTGDIVVTADIPLADRCIKKGACVVGPTGKPFTEDNIGMAVAGRNLMAGLRSAGEITGGPPPLNKRDRSRFLQQLDNIIQSLRREHP